MIITANFLCLPLSSQCISSSKTLQQNGKDETSPLEAFKREAINVLYCISGYYAASPGGQVFNRQPSKCCRLVTCFLIYLHDHDIPYTNHQQRVARTVISLAVWTPLLETIIFANEAIFLSLVFFYISSLLISMKSLYRELPFPS